MRQSSFKIFSYWKLQFYEILFVGGSVTVIGIGGGFWKMCCCSTIIIEKNQGIKYDKEMFFKSRVYFSLNTTPYHKIQFSWVSSAKQAKGYSKKFLF